MTLIGPLRSMTLATALVAIAENASAQAPAVVAPSPSVATACTPAHCHHRSIIDRRRCKRHLQEAVLGFPEEFERPPLGAMVYAANRAQVRNGEAAAMVLYRFDFEGETPRLNVRGTENLARIAARLPIAFDPVVVEPTGDLALDEARRMAIFGALASGPFVIPVERVVVASPIARGMRGEDAALIQDTALSRVRQSGPFLPSFDSTGTSFLRGR